MRETKFAVNRCNRLLHAAEQGRCGLWGVWKEGCGVNAEQY